MWHGPPGAPGILWESPDSVVKDNTMVFGIVNKLFQNNELIEEENHKDSERMFSTVRLYKNYTAKVSLDDWIKKI